jgi:hypothetical protein
MRCTYGRYDSTKNGGKTRLQQPQHLLSTVHFTTLVYR